MTKPQIEEARALTTMAGLKYFERNCKRIEHAEGVDLTFLGEEPPGKRVFDLRFEAYPCDSDIIASFEGINDIDGVAYWVFRNIHSPKYVHVDPVCLSFRRGEMYPNEILQKYIDAIRLYVVKAESEQLDKLIGSGATRQTTTGRL